MTAATRAACEAGLAGDKALRQVLVQRRAQLLPATAGPRDIAWFHGTRPTPHPHPPVRHNFAA